MPKLTLRVSEADHAEIVRRARLAGLSLTAYVRQAALAEDGASMLREVHAAVCGANGNGFAPEGKLAIKALVNQGFAPVAAREAVKRILTDNPGHQADKIVLEVYKEKR